MAELVITQSAVPNHEVIGKNYTMGSVLKISESSESQTTTKS